MPNAIMQRRFCRVLVDNQLLVNGLNLGPDTALVQIVPAVDRVMMGNFHWLFLANPNLQEVPVHAEVPEYVLQFSKQEEGEGVDIALVPRFPVAAPAPPAEWTAEEHF